MLSLLKSDIYKIFKRVSFYVCMILSVLSAGYMTWMQEQTIKEQRKAQFKQFAGFMNLDDINAHIDSLSGKDLGLTAWYGFCNNLDMVIMFSAIFLTIFISAEFSSGMCKNVLIRGKTKFSFYFSKLISCTLVSLMYSLIVCGVNFAIGAYKWQGYEWKSEYVNTYLIPLGWFMLVAISWQALLCMVCFLCQSSGLSMAINLGLLTLLPAAILFVIEYISTSWFNQTSIEYANYWVGSYSRIYDYGKQLRGESIPSDVLTPLIWAISSWFTIPTIVGSLCFWKKEIK